MNVVLDKSQQDAADKIESWFKKGDEQVFKLAGLAGTGKSTIVKYIIDQLGLEEHEVAFCAFTGKAAKVLSDKGSNATTIHRLMYKLDGETAGRPRFKRVAYLPTELKLIVVDEASMVSGRIQADLESYRKPILYVGDHGQLPPVGDDNNPMQEADICLEKIHRQAEGNPIIHLADLARRGVPIDMGKYSDTVRKVPKREFTRTDAFPEVTQILCGKNDTRKILNRMFRSEAGFSSEQPMAGDRVICLRNNYELGLVNGLTGLVLKQYEAEGFWDTTYCLDMVSDFGDTLDGVAYDPEVFRGGKVAFNDYDINPFDFAYAITVHKSQGSQYDHPLIYEEVLGDRKDHNHWLYTAITRAVHGLTIVATR